MDTKPKVAFLTLGCKLNYSETSSLSRLVEENGFEIVKPTEINDIVVINTCSVTNNAEAKCRNLVRKLLKTNPNVFIIVFGCYAQLKPNEIAAIPGVNVVLGNSEKFNLLDYLKDFEKNKAVVISNSDINVVKEFKSSYSTGARTRSFLKIQDGCDYFCSYCTIPFARGRSRSDNIKNVIKNIKLIAKEGIKEVVLSGINIGEFGINNNESFLELLNELENVNGIFRYRISSIEPNLLTDEIIELVSKSDKILPHFHMPLQSGSNKILAAMNRKYKIELFEDRVNKIKSIIPDCCIATDVIVGFPSENDSDFNETYDFLNKIEISYMHVFTYSERDGTKALNIKEIVTNRDRTSRSKILHDLSDAKKNSFYNSQKGKVRKVLFESENDNGVMYGFTDNYVKVKTEFNPILINEVTKVKLLEYNQDFIYNIELIYWFII